MIYQKCCSETGNNISINFLDEMNEVEANREITEDDPYFLLAHFDYFNTWIILRKFK